MVHMSTGVPIARVAIFHISTATRQVQKSLSKLARFEFVSFHFKSTECPLATQKAAQLFVKNIEFIFTVVFSFASCATKITMERGGRSSPGQLDVVKFFIFCIYLLSF